MSREWGWCGAEMGEDALFGVQPIVAASPNGEGRDGAHLYQLEQLVSSEGNVFAGHGVDAVHVAVAVVGAIKEFGLGAKQGQDLEPVLHVLRLLRIDWKQAVGLLVLLKVIFD